MVKTDFGTRDFNISDFPSAILSEETIEIEITELKDGNIQFKILLERRKDGEEVFEEADRMLYSEYSSIFKIVKDLHVGQRLRIKVKRGSNWQSMELLYTPDADNTIIPCS